MHRLCSGTYVTEDQSCGIDAIIEFQFLASVRVVIPFHLRFYGDFEVLRY